MYKFNFINSCNLIDLPLQNGPSTWLNFRDNPSLNLIDCFLILEKYAGFSKEVRQTQHIRSLPHHSSVGIIKMGPALSSSERCGTEHHTSQPLLQKWWTDTPNRDGLGKSLYRNEKPSNVLGNETNPRLAVLTH